MGKKVEMSIIIQMENSDLRFSSIILNFSKYFENSKY